MGKRYPTGPCKEQYDPITLMNTSLYNIKQIADQYGVQIEMTFTPEELRFRVIKKQGQAVKKSERSVANKDLIQFFNPQVFMHMVYDVLNQF